MSHLRLLPGITDFAPLDAAQSVRVLLADDHALMRRTLRLLLDGERDVAVVAETDDPASLVRDVDAHQPHVPVLDLWMPGGSSSAAIRQLRDQLPTMEIVIVTMEENPVFAQRAFASGAIGFVLRIAPMRSCPRRSAEQRAASGTSAVTGAPTRRQASRDRGEQLDRARGRGASLDRAWANECRDRPAAPALATNRGDTPCSNTPKARRRDARRTRRLRPTTRPAAKLNRSRRLRVAAAGTP